MALLMSSSATMGVAAEHVRRFPAPDLHDDRLGHSARPQVRGSRAPQIMDESCGILAAAVARSHSRRKFVASNTGQPDLRKCFLESATSSLVSARVRGSRFSQIPPGYAAPEQFLELRRLDEPGPHVPFLEHRKVRRDRDESVLAGDFHTFDGFGKSSCANGNTTTTLQISLLRDVVRDAMLRDKARKVSRLGVSNSCGPSNR